MKKIFNSKYTVIFLLFLTLFVSCREDVLTGESTLPEEGLPATINLKINVGDMKPGTRFAGFTPEDVNARKISSLWVGIYNVNSGNLVTSVSLDENYLEEAHEKNGEIELKDLSTVSGRYYVVAVANSHRHNGVIIGEEGSEGKKRNLEDLLMYNALTWEDYKKISVLLSNPISVSRIGDGFIMSGCYTEENNHKMSLITGNGNPPAVDIQPGLNETLDGRIHLQRLDSYIRFIVKADANITITPISWQVRNIPGASFVLERPGSCDANPSQSLKNASDAPKNDMFWLDNDVNVTSQYFYHDSDVFPSGYFVKGQDPGSYTFDFCMMENKHKGIISGEDKGYNEREREFKNDDGSNTGWYRSLLQQHPAEDITPTNSSPLYRNNNATFLELKVQVEYYHSNDGDFTPKPYNSEENLVRRIANAIYTIHLGNVKYGDMEADVNDFNCYRNTNTTYTVTIVGADNIRVEASSDDEIASGAEGTVTDIEEDFINLDCHYGVFNIQLTDEQRKNLTWRIRAPYGDSYIDMANGPGLSQFNSPVILNLSDSQNEGILNALPENQFYNWIQIVPTTEGVIARYPGDRRLKNRQDLDNYSISNIPDNPDDGVWYLEDLRDTENYKHWYSTQDGENIYRWYTVFIDEYVYEFDYVDNEDSMTGKNPVVNNWKNFINKDYRKFWIRLGHPDVSKDGESVYAKSIYMITQESIQTYYNDKAKNCLGIEHINESYTGENYSERWGGSYDIDGRLNTWTYVTNAVRGKWGNIGGDSSKLKEGKDRNDISTIYFLPDHNHNYMNGTLVRNRDLNGNGEIEDFELRWFLPSVSTYARIALGSVSLKTPLFNFLDYNEDDIEAGTGNAYSHFLASDGKYLWAEELAATGSQRDDIGKVCFGGNIRCVRYIGDPMTTPPGENNIDKAYSFDPETNTVTLTYYRTVAVRPETEGIIYPHFTGDISGYPARKFKIAKDDCKDEDGNRITSHYSEDGWIESIQNNDICGNYWEEGDENDMAQWRIPNISELAIMFFIDEELTDNKILTYGKENEDIRYISCSREYFINKSKENYVKRFMGIQVGKNISANFQNGGQKYIRCVKDVIE